MELKDGSLGPLLKNKEEMGTEQQVQSIAMLVFEQMLRALDFLAYNNIIHRDVKPDNILYTRTGGDDVFQFQLGDFGLCNRYYNANSIVGTPVFAAPERRSGSQTPKFDVWSLMVTLLWTLHFDTFVKAVMPAKEECQIVEIVLNFAAASKFKPLGPMAKVNPHERASAAQLLDKFFQGKGLSTPKRSITPLKVVTLAVSAGRMLIQSLSHIDAPTDISIVAITPRSLPQTQFQLPPLNRPVQPLPQVMDLGSDGLRS